MDDITGLDNPTAYIDAPDSSIWDKSFANMKGPLTGRERWAPLQLRS